MFGAVGGAICVWLCNIWRLFAVLVIDFICSWVLMLLFWWCIQNICMVDGSFLVMLSSGGSGFIIHDRINGEVGNDICVREWAYVWVWVLVPINIRGYKYSDCVWIILGRHARLDSCNELHSNILVLSSSKSDTLQCSSIWWEPYCTPI